MSTNNPMQPPISSIPGALIRQDLHPLYFQELLDYDAMVRSGTVTPDELAAMQRDLVEFGLILWGDAFFTEGESAGGTPE